MTLQRDELEAVDVDEPAVGDLQARDHGEREERQRQERRRPRPAERRARPRCTRGSARSPPSSGASESSPATGSGSSATHRGRRRRRRCRRRARRAVATARAMSSSLMPTTTMLWASCATVEASAPGCSPEPLTKPSPMRPVAEVALDDGDLGEVARGVRDGVPVDDAPALAPSDSVTTWSVTSPIARTRAPPSTGSRSSRGGTGWMRTRLPHPVGDGLARSLSSAAPRFSTTLRSEALEIGKEQQIGLIARCDRAEMREARARAPGGARPAATASSGATPAATASRTIPLM